MHLTTHFGSYWHFTLIEISTYICTIEHLFTLFFHSETFGELAQILDSVSFQSFSIRKFEIGSNSKKKTRIEKNLTRRTLGNINVFASVLSFMMTTRSHVVNGTIQQHDANVENQSEEHDEKTDEEQLERIVVLCANGILEFLHCIAQKRA